MAVIQDPKNKSQSISVTAFQSVAANEGLSPSPSFSAGRMPSMDAEMAQAIQLSLAGYCHLCTLHLSGSPIFSSHCAFNAAYQVLLAMPFVMTFAMPFKQASYVRDVADVA